jgi:bifunctional NMN adenylyltransferase/nudix hydrolase
MNKQYDALVLIGRFQGPHKAHFELIEKAAKQAHRVIIIIGSAHAPRSPKNPWTVEERIMMLGTELQRISSFTNTEFVLEENIDTIYDDDAWVARVQSIVKDNTKPTDYIGLIGFKKDPSTKRYLEMFPQWEYVDTSPVEVLDATSIRKLYFTPIFNPAWLIGVVPSSVLAFLMKFRDTPEFASICEEKRVIEAAQELRKRFPYPLTMVTVDSVVTQSGHVLLIRRGSHPGKGLWALPGGYFDADNDDTPLDGILRELEEETKIDVPKKVLAGCVREIKDFGAKGRSQIGRSITFAAHIVLPGGEWKLPKVKGSDDAAEAKWFPSST